MRPLKSLSADILFYGIGNFLYSLMQLICMPIIIRDMSMNEVANWNILLPTGMLLSAMVTFGMDSAIPRFVVDKEETEKKVIFSTGFYFVMGLAIVISFSLGSLATQTASLFNISSTHLTSYWILLGWLPGVIFSQYFQKWVQYTFQRNKFLGVIAFQSAIYLTIILYLKFSGQINLFNVMLASLASTWIPGFLGLYFSYNMITFKFDRSLLIKLVKYGGPFMILAFGFNLIFSFDKFILSRNVSPEEFAIYSQAFRIAAIFAMVVSSFNFAFGPFSLPLLNKEEGPGVFKKVKTYYLFFMCLTGVCFMAFGKLIILLLSGPEYISGYKYLPLFIIGYIFYGLYSFAQLGIIHSKKSYLGLYALIAGLIATISLDFLLVSQMKGFGTGLGYALGIAAMVLLANILSQDYLKIESNLLKDGVLVLIFIVFSFGFTNFNPIANLYIDSLAKLFIAAIVFGLLLLSPLFKSDPENLRKVLSTAAMKSKSS
ncbi:MAG: oligosaccharide flippase family protein [Nitrospinae bacterium]|nr:oligosaccharide flippase family protein [Nitrospinota bacterium]